MKYIRTEDEVFKAREEFCKGYYDNFGNPFFFEDIIKQANTIEELCDGFWFESNIYDPVYIPNYLIAKERFNAFEKSDKELGTNELEKNTFYGSIYIKGVGWKHVAKMNEEGKLELL